LTHPLHAQWATSVLGHHFGTSQTVGQGAAYFPANVLGAPTAAATATAPASLPQDVVSLGKGGFLALGFEQPVIDGPGPDFTVFENAFFYGDNEVFDEWMIVAVSEDGQAWHTFPYDTLTGAGMAGRTPTNGAANPLDPAVSGGDSFDMAALGLSKVRYVRMTDATRYQSFDRLSAEVDAVAAIYQLPVPTDAPVPTAALTWAYADNWLSLWSAAGTATYIALYNMAGTAVAQLVVGSTERREMASADQDRFWVGMLPAGIYLLRIDNEGGQMPCTAIKWVKE